MRWFSKSRSREGDISPLQIGAMFHLVQDMPLEEIPSLVQRLPAMAEHALMGGLELCDAVIQEGKNEQAQRLAVLAEAGWKQLGCEPGREALSLVERFARLDMWSRAESVLAVLDTDQRLKGSVCSRRIFWALRERDMLAAKALADDGWTLTHADDVGNTALYLAIVLFALDVSDLERAKQAVDFIRGEPAFDSARPHLRALIERRSQDCLLRGYLGLAEAFFAHRYWDQAIIAYDRAAALDPGSHEIIRNRGDALFAQGLTRKAIAEYERALSIEPGDSTCHRFLGHAFAKMGDFKRAVLHTEEALRLQPHYAEAADQLEELRRTEAMGDIS